ncbi:MAG: radical SAM protein [Candidatus Micrarchaeia archaeon]
MRVAIGTAILLGLENTRLSVAPRTAHFLLGARCPYGCAYCDEKEDTIARIKWPDYDEELVLSAFRKKNILFERVCVQGTGKATEEVISFIKKLNFPSVSACVRANNIDEIRRIFYAGAERVCIPLDAANPVISEKTGRGDFEKTLALLKIASEEFSGRITTHLIVGLGETEKELVELMRHLSKLKIQIALFAYVRNGTTETHIGQFRRMQVARYLLQSNPDYDFVFNENAQLIDSPKADMHAFMTSGCMGCNRPYFDSRPQAEYSFPRELTDEEYEKALNECSLYLSKGIRKCGKLLKVRVEHSNGKIKRAELSGDFFAYPEECIRELEGILAGCEIDKAKICSACADFFKKYEIYGFDAECLADAIVGACK